MLGLFVLGLISRRATNAGVVVGILAIVWLTFSPGQPAMRPEANRGSGTAAPTSAVRAPGGARRYLFLPFAHHKGCAQFAPPPAPSPEMAKGEIQAVQTTSNIVQ